MTIHVHLSEIETRFVNSLRAGLDRVTSVKEQAALVDRIHTIYEIIAVLDSIANDTIEAVRGQDQNTAVQLMVEARMIIRGFFSDPEFLIEEGPSQQPSPQAKERLENAADTVIKVDFTAQRQSTTSPPSP